jgi:hypothetical protein
MIDVISDNHVDEEEARTWTATGADRQELPDARDKVWEPELPQPRNALEQYLTKLLAPVNDAPRERLPQPAGNVSPDELPEPVTDEEQWLDAAPEPTADPEELFDEELRLPTDQDGPLDEPAARPLDVTDHHEPRGEAEAQGEIRPLWQSTEDDVPAAPRAGKVAVPTGGPSPSKAGRKPPIRPATLRERSGAGRQKAMVALIPVLVISLVVVLRHSLGLQPTVKAAAPPAKVAPPVATDLQIEWKVPSLYEPDGRDPMRLMSPATAVNSVGTASQPTEPPVDLVVTGILLSEDKPAAIVDTQVVHEGQQIAGATVEKIDRDGIQFERNGRRWKQTVSP